MSHTIYMVFENGGTGRGKWLGTHMTETGALANITKRSGPVTKRWRTPLKGKDKSWWVDVIEAGEDSYYLESEVRNTVVSKRE